MNAEIIIETLAAKYGFVINKSGSQTVWRILLDTCTTLRVVFQDYDSRSAYGDIEDVKVLERRTEDGVEGWYQVASPWFDRGFGSSADNFNAGFATASLNMKSHALIGWVAEALTDAGRQKELQQWREDTAERMDAQKRVTDAVADIASTNRFNAMMAARV